MIQCILTLLFALPLQAFSGLGHQQITHGAMQYLRTQGQRIPSQSPWISAHAQKALTHTVVDVDYQADFWMSAWYRAPFAGSSDEVVAMITSLYHFMNVTKPGVYWDFDGYAYRNTDGTGNDSYLGWPGMTARGDLSAPLGGADFEPSPINAALGPSVLGFKGSDEDWQRLYHRDSPMADCVLPPSEVPAQQAFIKAIRSQRALHNRLEEGTLVLPTAWKKLLTKIHRHRYVRMQVQELPQQFDLLGVSLHMLQDLSVPHHAQGLAGQCHSEWEEQTDRLACQTPESPTQAPYEDGNYDVTLNIDRCQHLYDGARVQEWRKKLAQEAPLRGTDIRPLLRATAIHAAALRFAKPTNGDIYGVTTPSNVNHTANNCDDLFASSAIHQHMRNQYCLATAASTLLLEHAWALAH